MAVGGMRSSHTVEPSVARTGASVWREYVCVGDHVSDSPPRLDTGIERFSSDRGTAWVRWLVGGLLVFSLIAGGLLLAIRVTTSSGTNADAETGGVVVLGELRVAVQREIPGYDVPNVTVWEARPAPEPKFDTSSLGPDRSFTPGKPSTAALVGLEGDVVYLGDHEGDPMILHARAAPLRNPWDHIYTFVMGRGDRRLLDATFPCCAFSYGDDGTIDPAVVLQTPGNPIVQWPGTPGSTSIVAVAVDGAPIGFQRPAGGIATMELGVSPPFLVTLTAFDASGHVLATTVLEFGPIP